MDEETGAILTEFYVTLAMKPLTYLDSLLAHHANIKHVENASSVYIDFISRKWQ